MKSKKMIVLKNPEKPENPDAKGRAIQKKPAAAKKFEKSEKQRNFTTIRRKKGRSWRPGFFARRGESVDSVRFFRAQTGLALGALLLLLALLREKTKHVGQFQRCSKSE